MAELADALDLGSSGNSRAGSTPVIRTGLSALGQNIILSFSFKDGYIYE